MPPLPPHMTQEEAFALLRRVDEGLASVRYAAKRLGWDPHEVQMELWGEVRQ